MIDLTRYDLNKQEHALHECGHAVIAAASGCHVVSVTIHATADTSGATNFLKPANDLHWDRTGATIFLAGAAAVGMVANGGSIRWDSHGASSDVREAAWHVIRRRPDPNDPNWIQTLLRQPEFASVARSTMSMVLDHAEAIHTLASALLDHHRLDAKQIDDVLKTFGLRNVQPPVPPARPATATPKAVSNLMLLKAKPRALAIAPVPRLLAKDPAMGKFDLAAIKRESVRIDELQRSVAAKGWIDPDEVMRIWGRG